MQRTFFVLILKKRLQKHQLKPPLALNMKGTSQKQDQTDKLSDNLSARSGITFRFLDQV